MADKDTRQDKGQGGGTILTTLLNRRRFLAESAKTACGVSFIGLGIATYSGGASALPPTAIRPPGALPEKEFLSACTRCGQCARDCPYDILKLADLGSPVGAGTPSFTARTDPCKLCEDIPCVKACPTGALDPELTEINKARMGLAVLIDQEACIAFQGLRCEVCFNICPIRHKAIKLEYRHNKRSGKHALFIPVVYSSDCTGCGLCEKACILDEAAIKVLPASLAKGKLGQHYRLGWEQKRDAGQSLVSPDPEHQFNMPKGESYDLQGRGWSGRGAGNNIPAPSSPFSSSPLDTLNSGIRDKK